MMSIEMGTSNQYLIFPIDNREIESKDRVVVPIRECSEHLVKLNDYDPRIVVQARYQEERVHFTSSDQFARERVAKKLKRAAEFLPKGYKLVVWDAWRSIEAQEAIIKLEEKKLQSQGLTGEKLEAKLTDLYSTPSKEPDKPPNHYTGGSVDVTIMGGSDGELLDMGSDFDDPEATAWTSHYENLCEEKLSGKEDISADEFRKIINIRTNRRLLHYVMTSVGFTNYFKEWWHFDFGNQFDAIRKGLRYAIYGGIELQV